MKRNGFVNAVRRGMALAVTAVLVVSVPSYGAASVQAAASERIFYEGVDYSQRPYEHYSVQAIDEAMEAFEKACAEEGREEDVAALYEQIISEFDHLATMSYMAQLRYDRDVSNQEAAAEQAYTTDLYSEVGNRVFACIRKGLNSSYRQLLEEKIGREYAYGMAYYEEETEEQQELNREEEELIRQYDQLAVSDITVEYNGESWTYKRLETEQELETDIYNNVSEALSREKNRLLGEKFRELVQVRNRIAVAAGYENYAEYAYESLYGRDYTLEDTRKLCRNVKDKILPLDDDIWYIDVDNASYDSLDELESSTTEEILDTVGPALGKIEAELGSIFQYMRDNHLYDIDAAAEGEDRTDNSYTVGLPSYGDAFIFINRDNTFRDYQSVIHEFGHFSGYHYNTLPELYQGYNVDVCEVQSQGLEMLALNYAQDMFGQGADAYVFETVTDMLYAAITACMIQEFEEAVYTAPDMSLEDMNRKFKEIQDSYNGWYFQAYGDECYEWVDIQHLFYSPVYYIGYGTSALSALDLWVLSNENWEDGVDTYLGILKEGLDAPYRGTMSKWGMRDMFDSEDMDSLAHDIRKLEGLEAEEYQQEEPEVSGGIEHVGEDADSSSVSLIILLGIGTIIVLQVMILCTGLVIMWLVVKRREGDFGV